MTDVKVQLEIERKAVLLRYVADAISGEFELIELNAEPPISKAADGPKINELEPNENVEIDVDCFTSRVPVPVMDRSAEL